ncbi:DNA-binding NarL/FixJ family response regulator [Hydrogenophaga palleronii]|uniref:DNA-binding NarL/FixJ family response regulator n=1 Tax=Hydrogenophaga palleronii TaxID=65655 RepID=A0ABU1WSJ6_9BURK|nr:response regulator transcription factor [Hydrogenophaga palleronii]MDR7152265.1 DNA-binding NarL/FixJ family response regulator [Hydrogenophaga palleronii]
MSTLKTFIVEDNPLIYENLVSTLEELTSVEVVGSAADEASAVQWLREEGNQVDLLIIDIFLLNGSGLGVLQAAKDDDLAVRRVVLTNYASADIRRRCAALGADRVFDKSCELDELIAYCAHVADGTTTAPGALG